MHPRLHKRLEIPIAVNDLLRSAYRGVGYAAWVSSECNVDAVRVFGDVIKTNFLFGWVRAEEDSGCLGLTWTIVRDRLK